MKAIGASPDRMSVLVETAATATEDTTLVELDPNNAIFDSAGRQVFNALEMANALLDEVLSNHLDPLLRDATGEEKSMEVATVVGGDDLDTHRFLKNMDTDPPSLHRIREIRLVAKINLIVRSIPMRYAEMQGSRYAFGAGRIPGYELTIVTTNLERDSPPAPGQMASRITPIQ